MVLINITIGTKLFTGQLKIKKPPITYLKVHCNFTAHL
tara:strand:+ start:582 stop:695 length:114 start_codon:yes stop_codon:yes gene_type:complete